MNKSPRARIAEILMAVIVEGNTLDTSLDGMRAKNPNPTTSAYIQNSVYTVIRRYYELDSLLTRLMARPLRSRDRVIRMLLLAGLNELLFLKTPNYAVVDESVSACADLDRGWAKGLVNGILRSTIRNPPCENSSTAEPELRWNHSGWLVSAISQDWPEFTEQIFAANNTHPPFIVRVNQARTTRECYLELLANCGISARAVQYAPLGVHVLTPCPVEALPGFSDGLLSVQDEAAQLAAPLLNCAPTDRVLDACAAPGGKATHLLEMNPDLDLTAIDISTQRLKDIEENLSRLGLHCRVRRIDANQLKEERPRRTFERILLDAPCSGLGVIRRHPDIKLHRTPDDLPRAAAQQLQLIKSLWPLLVPGGELLYATCSLMRVENDAVIAAFLETQNNSAEIREITENWGRATTFGRQILPGDHNMDGFYYARIAKRSVSNSP